MNLAFSHEPGTAIACLSIPIILHKEGPPGIPETDLKCGFKIGGGIDQDYKKSPQVRWQFKIKFDLESIGSSLGHDKNFGHLCWSYHIKYTIIQEYWLKQFFCVI